MNIKLQQLKQEIQEIVSKDYITNINPDAAETLACAVDAISKLQTSMALIGQLIHTDMMDYVESSNRLIQSITKYGEPNASTQSLISDIKKTKETINKYLKA